MYETLITDVGNIAYKSYSRGGTAIMFCGGYNSEMTGYKVSTIENFCAKHSISFTKFDYIGHGTSSGVFLECNISIWLKSAAYILEQIKEEKVIIVGSSMGGWIALLLAKMFPKRVKALLCVAPAPDFTEDMYSNMNEEAKKKLMEKGIVSVIKPNGIYTVTKDFILDGRKNLLLNSEVIQVDIPVHILHAINDDVVNYKKSLMIMEKLASKEVEITLIKNSDHPMNGNIEILLSKINTLLDS